MLTALAPVSALLLGVVVLLVGHGLQGTLLPVRASMEDFTPLDVGILGSAYFGGFVIGCLLSTHLVRRVGHIRVLAALTAVASAVPLVHLLFIHPLLWWILRILTGFCLAGLYLVIESWLNERSPNAFRGTVMSVYTTLHFAAITVGQMLLTLYDPTAFHLFVITSVLLSLAAVPVALSTAPAPALPAAVRFRPLRLVEISPTGVAGCFMIGIVNGAFWSLGPAFALTIGLDPTGVAIFMSVTVIGGALSQWPAGHVSDRMDRRRVMVLCSTAACAASAALFLSGMFWPHATLAIAFVFGAASFPLYALAVSHVNDLIRAEEFVETSSGLLLVNGMGSVLGPLGAAMLMYWHGAGGLFLFTALAHGFMAAFALTRMGAHEVSVERHHGSFVRVVAETTPAIVPLDPRAPDGEEEARPAADASRP